MIILAIETSCDDTCIAILKIENYKLKILSNIVSSQVKIHKKYGGVYPFLAKREHQRNLPLILDKALRKADLSDSNFQFLISKKITNSKLLVPKIDLIAVTIGPGLEPCLWTGINFAKALSQSWKKPLIPVNHIEAHIFSNFLSRSEEIKNLRLKIKNYFPAICLIVSGGHTQLVLMKDIGKYKILGETRDDAAGECFDKTARILGLDYPGGPAIARYANQWKSEIKNEKSQKNSKFQILNSRFSVKLPRPMINQKNYDFSFSGLKTAVLYLVKDLTKNKKSLTLEKKREISFEIQQAIIDVLISKTLRAAKEFKAKSIVLAGGVAANHQLREQLAIKIKKEIPKTKYLMPDIKYCTDNAAMIALTAFLKVVKNNFRIKKIDPLKIKANSNLRIDENLL